MAKQTTLHKGDRIFLDVDRVKTTMKQITFRELQTKLPDVKDDPVEITRYGKVVAVLVHPDMLSRTITGTYILDRRDVTATKSDVTATFKKNPHMVEVLQQLPKNLTATPKYELEPTMAGRCQAPNCKTIGDLFDGEYKEWYEGELKTKPMLLCKKCLKKYEAMTE